MTIPANTDPADQNPPEDAETPPDAADETDPPADESEELRAARSEAASRRRQLRDVEQTVTARDETITAQAQTIATLQRQVVERLIEGDASLPYMHRPGDLFDVAGVDLADLTDDAGGVDTERLSAALTKLSGERGYLFGERPSPPDQLARMLARQVLPKPGSGGVDTGDAWAAALRGTSE